MMGIDFGMRTLLGDVDAKPHIGNSKFSLVLSSANGIPKVPYLPRGTRAYVSEREFRDPF